MPPFIARIRPALRVPLLLLLLAAILGPVPALAGNLFVVSAGSAELADGRLVLTEVDETLLWFADRPERDAGRTTPARLVGIWSEGADSFAAVPPNAVLVGKVADGSAQRLVMELSDPAWRDGALSFAVAALQAPLPERLQLAAADLFIDADDGSIEGGTWPMPSFRF